MDYFAHDEGIPSLNLPVAIETDGIIRVQYFLGSYSVFYPTMAIKRDLCEIQKFFPKQDFSASYVDPTKDNISISK